MFWEETLCKFSQIFPPKNLEKIRALKIRMRQLFKKKIVNIEMSCNFDFW